VPRLVNYTLAFALQLRKKHGKPSVRVANELLLQAGLGVIPVLCDEFR
jgi:hypothetical protein